MRWSSESTVSCPDWMARSSQAALACSWHHWIICVCLYVCMCVCMSLLVHTYRGRHRAHCQWKQLKTPRSCIILLCPWHERWASWRHMYVYKYLYRYMHIYAYTYECKGNNSRRVTLSYINLDYEAECHLLITSRRDKAGLLLIGMSMIIWHRIQLVHVYNRQYPHHTESYITHALELINYPRTTKFNWFANHVSHPWWIILNKILVVHAYHRRRLPQTWICAFQNNPRWNWCHPQRICPRVYLACMLVCGYLGARSLRLH